MLQINNVAAKNHDFWRADTICANLRLGGVNARNYKIRLPKDCGQRGRASQNRKNRRRRIDEIFTKEEII